ncbi:MAG: prepilin peptidase [Bacteriovoracaceae bacterium]|nr:prepilin peptidase [Bacteriovoracaceae bacterium]
MSLSLLLEIYAAILGLMFGSLLNVLILRLPKNEDTVKARSCCPKCSRQLKWYHNIPVLSFAFLRGKCAYCEQKISWQYPIVEIITGIAAWLLAPKSFDMMEIMYFVLFFSVFCAFLVHFVVDVRHQILPDQINLFLLVLFLCYVLFFRNWTFWLSGAAIGFLGTLSVTWIFYKIKGQIGLGGGDIKLYGILGLYLGPFGIVQNIFLSCTLGAVVGLFLIGTKRMTRNDPLAFGPFIIIIATFQIFFPESFQSFAQMIFPS